jgi:hydrogenase 3 maturation protease
MKKVVIGIGNPLKRDDNIGNLVVDELKKIVKDRNTLFIRAETNPENFIGKIKKFKPNATYFVDAVEFDGNIGEVKVFDINDVLNKNLSTHDIPVKVFKDFFPDTEIYIIGIKHGDVGYGEELTLTLKENFGNVIREIKKLLI